MVVFYYSRLPLSFATVENQPFPQQQQKKEHHNKGTICSGLNKKINMKVFNRFIVFNTKKSSKLITAFVKKKRFTSISISNFSL